jgi:alkanesulfonate monooxygenase SsuD/methylene tetrahydromethanopterin reductase-like flavin-dependent oxidoreductase (luciferase family)
MGGWGTKRTPRLAAKFAAEFNMPFAPVSYFREGCDHVRAACDAIGRDPATMKFTIAVVVCVGRDEQEFRRRAVASGQDPEQARATAGGGTPEEVVERIEEFAAAGAETVYLQYHTLDDPDHLELIGTAVLPHVGDLHVGNA